MAEPSFVVKCLEEPPSIDVNQQEEVIKDVAGMIFIGELLSNRIK